MGMRIDQSNSTANVEATAGVGGVQPASHAASSPIQAAPTTGSTSTTGSLSNGPTLPPPTAADPEGASQVLQQPSIWQLLSTIESLAVNAANDQAEAEDLSSTALSNAAVMEAKTAENVADKGADQMMHDASISMGFSILGGVMDIAGGIAGVAGGGEAGMAIGQGAGKLAGAIGGYYSTKGQAADQKAQAQAGYDQALAQNTAQGSQSSEKTASDLWTFAQALIQKLNEINEAKNQALNAAAGR